MRGTNVKQLKFRWPLITSQIADVISGQEAATILEAPNSKEGWNQQIETGQWRGRKWDPPSSESTAF